MKIYISIMIMHCVLFSLSAQVHVSGINNGTLYESLDNRLVISSSTYNRKDIDLHVIGKYSKMNRVNDSVFVGILYKHDKIKQIYIRHMGRIIDSITIQVAIDHNFNSFAVSQEGNLLKSGLYPKEIFRKINRIEMRHQNPAIIGNCRSFDFFFTKKASNEVFEEHVNCVGGQIPNHILSMIQQAERGDTIHFINIRIERILKCDCCVPRIEGMAFVVK